MKRGACSFPFHLFLSLGLHFQNSCSKRLSFWLLPYIPRSLSVDFGYLKSFSVYTPVIYFIFFFAFAAKNTYLGNNPDYPGVFSSVGS